MFGFARPKRIHPYSPSTASGSSRFSLDHTFRSIENLTNGLHPLKHLFVVRHIPYTQRRATDPLHGDDTYLKKRYSQFYMAVMDAHILETTWAPLWIFFNLLVSKGLTWAITGKDVSIERCPKALIRRQACLTESCVNERY